MGKNTSLRLLIISHMFPSRMLARHGVFMCREAEYLANYGIESHFLVARPLAPWPLYQASRWASYGPGNALLKIDALPTREVKYVRPPGMWFRRFEGRSMARALKNVARVWHKEQGFDVALGFPMIPDAEAAVAVTKELSIPLATLAIGSDVMVYPEQTPVLQSKLSHILHNVDLPVGASASICRRLAETGSCKREPLRVYLSRDEEKFSPAYDRQEVRQNTGWPENGIVGTYVGRISDTKGIRELAIAAEALLKKYPEFTLVCVGDGPDMDRLLRLKEKVDRSQAVILPGQVAPEGVPVFLRASDFMVFPSHSEGMPQSVLEAMNCGLPVVATRVGGIPEAVIDGQTGILVDPQNDVQLRSAMERMICDRQFRSIAGQRGRERALKEFDSKSNAERFAQALWALRERAC